MRWFFGVCLWLLCSNPLAAQTLNLQSLDRLSGKATETVNVSLDSSLLQMAVKFLSADDPDQAKIRQLVSGLSGIYVRSFEFKQQGSYTKSDLDAVRVQLKSPAWSRIVDVQGESESSEIYLRNENGAIAGVAVLNSAPKEVTVVQIVGKIDLDNLSRLGGSLGIPNIKVAPNTKKSGAK